MINKFLINTWFFYYKIDIVKFELKKLIYGYDFVLPNKYINRVIVGKKSCLNNKKITSTNMKQKKYLYVFEPLSLICRGISSSVVNY